MLLSVLDVAIVTFYVLHRHETSGHQRPGRVKNWPAPLSKCNYRFTKLSSPDASGGAESPTAAAERFVNHVCK